MSLVVVHDHVFAVVRDAVPVAGSHHALLVVLSGVGERAGDLFVPFVFLDVVVEVRQQALAGEQAGGSVALVVFHDVGRLVGVEDL